MPIAEGRTYSFEDVSKIDTSLLETFPFDNPEQVIEITTPEFSAVCPFSGLPDIATVTVRYCPNGRAIELKSFKYYLLSYRNVGIYQELATKQIRADLELVLKTDVFIQTVYNTRGGIDVVCTEGSLVLAETGTDPKSET